MHASDVSFDKIYPDRIRELSAVHWTPHKVATAAARFLCENGASQILDVGSGAGKFCLVAALEEPHCHFTGVEHRLSLVRLSKKIALKLNLKNTHFICEDSASVDWQKFDGLYFYNPFYEQIAHEKFQIDSRIETSEDGFREFVAVAEEKLAAMPGGTRVATYNGFGGTMPETYVLIKSRKYYHSLLEFWIKQE